MFSLPTKCQTLAGMMMTAILVCGLTVLTACSTTDDPATPQPTGVTGQWISYEEKSGEITDDELPYVTRCQARCDAFPTDIMRCLFSTTGATDTCNWADSGSISGRNNKSKRAGIFQPSSIGIPQSLPTAQKVRQGG